MRRRALTLLFGLLLAFACSQPGAPTQPQGSVAFALLSASTAQQIDSLAVRIFRPGPGVTLEVAGGKNTSSGPTEVQLTCIAESGKRIGVELFASGIMTHVGVAENVDVPPNERTSVVVDAYDFLVESVWVSAAVVNQGQLFRVTWDGARAATAYHLQESTTPDFTSVIWETSLSDTTLLMQRDGGGGHYFRVAPVTPYALGTFSKSAGTYVLAGSQVTTISSVDKSAAIPGDQLTIRGENLDYPGIQILWGSTPCQIVSASWDAVVVTLPSNGTTDYVWAGSLLGWDSSPDPVVAQRIAYVTTSGTFANGYREVIEKHADTIEGSGVAIVPVAELDWRDMSVFDVIIVGNDTGTSASNWGGGVPARASAIFNSGSGVLAVGVGGATYLALSAPIIAGVDFSTAAVETYYTPDGSVPVFTTPFKVADPGPATISFCSTPRTSVTMDISVASKPGAMQLHASIGAGVNRWTLVEFTLNINLRLIRHFFWGYAADPAGLTTDGQNCLSNAVYQLYYGGDGPVPVQYSP